MKGCRTIVASCLLILQAVLVITDAQQQLCRESDAAGGRQVCTSRSCVTAASRVIATINETADPCVDFYEFACGNWYTVNPPPKYEEDEGFWSVFTKQQEDKDKQLTGLLRKNSESLEDIGNYIQAHEAFRKLKIFYDSCVDVSTKLARGIGPLSDFVDNLGGFQLMPGTDFSNFDLTNLVQNLLLYDAPLMFDIRITSNYTDNSKQSIWIAQAPDFLKIELTPARFRVSANTEYTGARAQVFSLLSMLANESLVAAENEDTGSGSIPNDNALDAEDKGRLLEEAATRMTDFFLDLQLLRNNSRLTGVSEVTVFQLQTYVPMIDWVRLMRGLGMPGAITSSTPVYVPRPDYFMRLGRYLTSDLVTRRILYNSHIMRAAMDYRSFVPVFDPRLFRSERQYLSFLSLVTEEKCLAVTKRLFPTALSALYIRSEQPEVTKRDIQAMVEYIRETLINDLNSAQWLSSSSRSAAVQKASEMVKHVSHPDFLFDDDALDALTSNKSVNRLDYFNNVISLYRVSRESMYQSQGDTIDRQEWYIALYPKPFALEAAYAPALNSMFVVHAMLNRPYYHPDLPKYMNFGGIGFLVGHEITHGFDISGRRFDSKGNPGSWMSNQTYDNFLSSAGCYLHQYDQMRVRFLNTDIAFEVDGLQTLTENIADNGGITLAYNAYQRSLVNSNHLYEPSLPGLSYTPEQLFFINTGQIWCGKYQDISSLMQQLRTDTHSPNQPRVNGMMMNSQAFSDAFSCPIGSPMNPRSKCELW